MKQNLGLDFIHRTLKTTGIVLLVVMLPVIYYFGVYPALAVFFGGVWGMVNFIFLTALVRAALRPDGVDKIKVAGLALVKFPLLYLSGYFLLKVKEFEPLHLLIGFSTLLAVMLLKVIARALLGMDNEPAKEEHLTGAA
ncbi:MAG TPA: ATP synthase subunit I [Candidatus Deferrimicrobium sp.]|nr:ATP synthase subunit I [Candidatus Deferrimicrobium sp.]